MNRIAAVLAKLVDTAPRSVVLLVLVVSAGLGVASTEVVTATGNEGFAPDNVELAALETLTERFGETGEDVLQVLVTGDDVVSADGLAAVTAVTAALEASEAAEHLSEQPQRPAVLSFIGPAQQALAEQYADPEAVDDVTVTAAYTDGLAALEPQEAGLVAGLLPEAATADDADAGLMLVFVDAGEGPGGVDAFDRLIEIESELAAAARGADLPAGFAAEAFSFQLLFSESDAFDAELVRLFASAFAIIIVILGFVYWLRPTAGLTRLGAGRRTVADVLLTMATILMAITWMNGVAALLGPGYLGWIGGLTEVSQIIPVLLIGLGVDYAIHLTSRYREEVGGGAQPAAAISRAVVTVGVALTLATVTTAVGFLTNIVNPVPALKDFGVLAAVGIVAAFVLMMTFVPAMRLLLDRRAGHAGRLSTEALGRTSERLLPGVMARTAVLAERIPVATVLVSVVLGGSLGVWGLTQLETRFSATDFVPDDSPVVATLDAIQERFAGGFGETTEALLTGDVATPAAHNALVAVGDDLGDVDDVAVFDGAAQAESPLSVLAMLLAPGPDGQPTSPAVAEAAAAAGVGEDLRVEGDADVAGLYLTMLDAAPEQATRVLATNGDDIDLARVGIQTSAGEEHAGQLAGELDTVFAPVEDAGVDVVITSNPIVNDAIIDALQDSQVTSMVITLLAAMALLVATFWVREHRPALGVVTTLPVVLVVLWTFAMMAATGIPFGPVTATIAALAIGIGIPYSIHVTNRYLEDRKTLSVSTRFARDAAAPSAIRATVRHTGGALAGSALTTCAGFGVLVTSSLTPFRQFGMVTVYAIGFALLAATLVLPSLLTLWDRWHLRRARITDAETEPPSEEPAPALP